MRRAPREIDKTIHYFEPYVEGKGRVKVPIKMRSNNGEKIEFYTPHFKDDDGRKKWQMFDKLNELYDWIEDELATEPDIVWVSKIYIRVKGDATADLDGHENYHDKFLAHCEIQIYADIIELGTAPDGRQWSRAPGKPKSKQKFTKNMGYGFEKETYYWKKDDPDDPGKPYSRALIDDTPENRELVVQLAIKFDELRDQFFRAMSQDYVHKFLAQTAGTLLLNAPLEEQKNGNKKQPRKI